MFVITRSLGKFSGDRILSDSDMPPAKAQRGQVRIRCHFDRREKSLFRARREIFFLAPSHPLGMTGIGPSPLRPWRPFDVAQDMLCGRYSESWLRRSHAGFSVGIFERCASAPYPILYAKILPSCPESALSSIEGCLRGENCLSVAAAPLW